MHSADVLDFQHWAVNDVNNESNREVTIQYEVTGDAKDSTVTYTTFGESVSTSQEAASTLPWTKEVKTTGLGKAAPLPSLPARTAAL